jgi:hypothetical protein
MVYLAAEVCNASVKKVSCFHFGIIKQGGLYFEFAFVIGGQEFGMSIPLLSSWNVVKDLLRPVSMALIFRSQKILRFTQDDK